MSDFSPYELSMSVTQKRRDKIKADTEAYLNAGGVITCLDKDVKRDDNLKVTTRKNGSVVWKKTKKA